MIATSTQLAFDPESHVYSVDGRPVPSVTQVINSILPGWQADEWYLAKGTAMHHGCRLMDEGQLDWSSVAPEIEGRLRAWARFRKEFPATCVAIEQPMYGPLGYAGTLDRVFDDDVSGLRGLILADIKSHDCPQARVQLGGYAQLWNGRPNAEIVTRGLIVELRDNATYSTTWLDKKQLDYARRTYLACLTIHNFRLKEKLV